MSVSPGGACVDLNFIDSARRQPDTSLCLADHSPITHAEQETRMLSQALGLNRAMQRSRSHLEERVNRKEIIVYLAVQL